MADTSTLNDQKSIILFDGVCNLCNGAINFVIDRDKEGVFKFAALQSAFGQDYLSQNNKPIHEFDSMVLMEGGRVYTKSTAALRIARNLSGGWPLLFAFIIVPKFIRDAVYDLIANNRYKWFGKRDQCRLPTPELQAKFLN